MTTSRARRTHGLRVLPGGGDLAVRVSLDYEQTLFRRNYRRPVLVAAAVTAEAEDVARWSAAGALDLLGADVAARALNRIAAEGAEPLMLQAIVRGGRGDDARRATDGMAEACLAADCAFIDELLPAQAGQGGGELLTVMAAATGVVEKSRMMDVRRFEPGDAVLAIGSDRLWPDTLDPARQALRTAAPDKPLGDLGYTAAEALVRPAPVLAGSLQQVLRQYHVKRVVHAMTPVEADGLAAALERLTAGRFEVRRGKPRRAYSALMAALDLPESVEGADEGHLAGIGFLMVAGSPFAAAIARRLRRAGHPVYQFGRLAEAASHS
ncbi:MAG TPA: hypothetical protein PLP01_05905 [Phycisphaerae bacterium]|nr:hypothetical protein [Phycisphaerae bacterium]HOI54763.1 hypothetical protein [Phycisphaerae bacterium]